MAWNKEKRELHESGKFGAIALHSVIIRLDRIIQVLAEIILHSNVC
jgi:hypothetical protein